LRLRSARHGAARRTGIGFVFGVWLNPVRSGSSCAVAPPRI
jgi:hypothetical protein